MARFTQKFKVKSAEKALSRRAEQTLKNRADDLGVGLSTLQRWIRLAKENKLKKPDPTMLNEKITLGKSGLNENDEAQATLTVHYP